MSSKMTMLLLPIIWMTLFKVVTSYDHSSYYENIVWNSTPSYVPIAYRDRNDPWIIMKRAELERARMRDQEVETAKSEYGLRGVKSPNLNPDQIQFESKRLTMPPQRRDQPKKLVYYRCYFNVVSCF